MSTTQTSQHNTGDDPKRQKLDALLHAFWEEPSGQDLRPDILQQLIDLDPHEGAHLAMMVLNSDLAIDKRAIALRLVGCQDPAVVPVLTELYLALDHQALDMLKELILRAAFDRDPESRWDKLAEKATNESHWPLRQIVAKAASESPEEVPGYIYDRLLWDTDNDVRAYAMDGLRQLPASRQRKHIDDMFMSEYPDVMKSALQLRVELDGLEESIARITPLVFHATRNDAAQAVAAFLHEHKPSDDQGWHRWILTHPDRATKCTLLDWAAETEGFQDPALFQRVLASSDGDIQRYGLRGLMRCATPAQAIGLARAAISHDNNAVRIQAMEHLGQCDRDAFDDVLISQLLQQARDPHGPVRAAALRALAASSDPHGLTELLSSLDDVDQHVRNTAEELLESHRDTREPRSLGLGPWDPKMDDKPWWFRLRYRIALIHHWARHVGQELLGVPVHVHPYREGLGRTWTRKPDEPIDIEISDTPMTSGHIFGDQIMKGLILHELGHHLFDINQRGHRSMRGIARSEGLKDLHDIVIDERLERAMRSRRPRWGVYFDRLASYAFAQNVYRVPLDEYGQLVDLNEEELIDALETGALPGTLLPRSRTSEQPAAALRERDLLAIPGAIGLHTAFLWCLRCGFDPRRYQDPRVAEAIDLIPSNLKDISQAEVLQVVRKIGDLLGRGDCIDQERRTSQQRWGRGKVLGRMLSQVMDRMDQSMQLPASARTECNAHSCRESALPEINIIYERPTRSNELSPSGQSLNLGAALDIPLLESDLTLPYDVAGMRGLVQNIRPHVRRLRTYFERLGTTQKESFASRRGRRLDIVQARKSAFVSTPNLLIHTRTEIAPDLYMGLLIDRSGSMEGAKLQRALSFAALVAESVQGIRGIEGHINAFDCTHFVHMGDFQRNGMAGLNTFGGNNDGGAMLRAADMALKSHKKRKLLIMISDGSPTECSVTDLKQLIQQLTRQRGIICAQVAVDALPEIAFPHYVDLSAYGLDEAVSRFGRMLIKLTSHWR